MSTAEHTGRQRVARALYVGGFLLTYYPLWTLYLRGAGWVFSLTVPSLALQFAGFLVLIAPALFWVCYLPYLSSLAARQLRDWFCLAAEYELPVVGEPALAAGAACLVCVVTLASLVGHLPAGDDRGSFAAGVPLVALLAAGGAALGAVKARTRAGAPCSTRQAALRLGFSVVLLLLLDYAVTPYVVEGTRLWFQWLGGKF